MITLFKRIAADTLFHLGLLRLWKAVVLRRKAVVLMYHRVLTSDESRRAGSHPGIVVERDTFAWQMDLLQQHFTVVNLAEFLDGVEGRRPFAPSSCLITFDDGWRDNYDNALPILRARRLPSVLFLPVSFIGRRQMFWREALTQLLSRAVVASRGDLGLKQRLGGSLASIGLIDVLDLSASAPHPQVVEAVSARMTALEPPSADQLDGLASTLGADLAALAEDDAFIDWAQAAEMANAGCALGGHGVSHRPLTGLQLDDARREIEGAYAALSAAGHAPVAFSYPNGHWNADVAALTERAGYHLAFTTEGGAVKAGDNAWSLRRVNIHQGATHSPGLFMARILGLM